MIPAHWGSLNGHSVTLWSVSLTLGHSNFSPLIVLVAVSIANGKGRKGTMQWHIGDCRSDRITRGKMMVYNTEVQNQKLSITSLGTTAPSLMIIISDRDPFTYFSPWQWYEYIHVLYCIELAEMCCQSASKNDFSLGEFPRPFPFEDIFPLALHRRIAS